MLGTHEWIGFPEVSPFHFGNDTYHK
jgi:hypothetical protein